LLLIENANLSNGYLISITSPAIFGILVSITYTVQMF